VKLNQMIAS